MNDHIDLEEDFKKYLNFMIGYLRLSYGKALQYKLDSLFTIGEKAFFFPF